MSFIILPKNAAKDAVLVEQKSGTTTKIDDSTPLEVNVQQPVEVSDDDGLDRQNTLNSLMSDIITEQRLTNLYLSQIVGEDLRLDNEIEDI